MKKCKRVDGIYKKRGEKNSYKRSEKGVKSNVKKGTNYNKMEYCLGNGLELFSASKVFPNALIDHFRYIKILTWLRGLGE